MILKIIFLKVFHLLKPKNVILFESAPSFSDNTRAVFEELVERGYNKKYKMVWWLYDDSPVLPKIHNVIFISNKGRFNHLRFYYYNEVAKCLISCNRILEKKKNKQYSIYLNHGTPLKNMGSYFKFSDKIDKAIIPAEGVRYIYRAQYKESEEQIKAIGYPRNDVLFKSNVNMRQIFDHGYEKTIIWLPTYRQHKNPNAKYHGENLPILSNIENANEINEIAKRLNCLIVLKPHFAQNIDHIKKLMLSNIVFIDDTFFSYHNTTFYKFLSGCDALITDYSSVFFDFLICDKPIGLVLTDTEDYIKDTGLIPDYDTWTRCAHRIFNTEDLKKFISEVYENTDHKNALRKETMSCSNNCCNNSTSLVTDYIIESACL